MLRTSVCLAAMLLVVGALHTASAQTAAPATTPTPAAKPSKMKLTADRLKEMKAKWSANKGKLAVCRKEVKSKGLAGDDRWFYIEDCMARPESGRPANSRRSRGTTAKAACPLNAYGHSIILLGMWHATN